LIYIADSICVFIFFTMLNDRYLLEQRLLSNSPKAYKL
jgi:hypothetical protein